MYRTALRGTGEVPRATGAETVVVASARQFVGFAKLFAENTELLGVLAGGGTGSIASLAKRLGRDPGNLGRTLHKLEAFGIVRLEAGPEGAKCPVLAGERLELTLDLRSGQVLLG